MQDTPAAPPEPEPVLSSFELRAAIDEGYRLWGNSIGGSEEFDIGRAVERAVLAKLATQAAQPAEVPPAVVPVAEPSYDKNLRRLTGLWRFGREVLPTAPVSFEAFLFQLDTLIDGKAPIPAPAPAAPAVQPAAEPVPAPAQEGEALRTALKRIVSRIDLEERIKTLGVDCGQKRLHRLYRMPSIRTMAEEALRAAPPPIPVAPMGPFVEFFHQHYALQAAYRDLVGAELNAAEERFEAAARACRAALVAAPTPVQQETGHE